jgi:hypothetical protein
MFRLVVVAPNESLVVCTVETGNKYFLIKDTTVNGRAVRLLGAADAAPYYIYQQDSNSYLEYSLSQDGQRHPKREHLRENIAHIGVELL